MSNRLKTRNDFGVFNRYVVIDPGFPKRRIGGPVAAVRDQCNGVLEILDSLARRRV